MTDTTPTPTPMPHRATPEQWLEIFDWDELHGKGSRWTLASAVHELLSRVEALEAQQQAQPEPEPEQSLHTVALDIVDSLGRSFGLLPEILDTLRRAIREPMDPPAPCPHIVTSDEGSSYCGLAEQQAQPAAPAGDAGGLERELLNHLAHMTANFASRAKPGEDCTPFARFAIRIVARWLRANGVSRIAADRLEQEAGR